MQMNDYRVIVFDVDGTILDSNYQVCASLKEITTILIKLGYRVILASGRIPDSLLDIARELKTNDVIIALNGSMVVDSNKNILYNQKFPLEKVRSLLNQCIGKVTINYFDEFNWMVDDMPQVRTNCNKIDLNMQLKYPTTNINRLNSNISKITIQGSTHILKSIQDTATQEEFSDIACLFSGDNYLEVCCKHISKFNALSYVLQQINIDKSQVIAFGDAENDISLFQQVGLGVAMGNAPDHVKHYAHAVAKNNDQQGVAVFIQNLLAQGVLRDITTPSSDRIFNQHNAV
jgi:Cof subfamily protein (haloacid dehalogenase superfamily)